MEIVSDDEPEPEYIHISDRCAAEGGLHAIATRDGRVLGMGHAQVAKDGQALLPGQTLYHVDPTGKVVSAIHASGAGPAKVTTSAYRQGWDHVFGNQTVGQA